MFGYNSWFNSGGSVWKYIFFFKKKMVMVSPEAQISDSESLFVVNIFISVEIEKGGRKSNLCCCCLG